MLHNTKNSNKSIKIPTTTKNQTYCPYVCVPPCKLRLHKFPSSLTRRFLKKPSRKLWKLEPHIELEDLGWSRPHDVCGENYLVDYAGSDPETFTRTGDPSLPQNSRPFEKFRSCPQVHRPELFPGKGIFTAWASQHLQGCALGRGLVFVGICVTWSAGHGCRDSRM